VGSDEKETNERSGEVGKRHERDRESHVELRRTTGVSTLPMPKPAIEAIAPASTAATVEAIREQVHALILLCR
jgi:hypothetical protein